MLIGCSVREQTVYMIDAILLDTYSMYIDTVPINYYFALIDYFRSSSSSFFARARKLVIGSNELHRRGRYGLCPPLNIK